jgi:hypothetical protein
MAYEELRSYNKRRRWLFKQHPYMDLVRLNRWAAGSDPGPRKIFRNRRALERERARLQTIREGRLAHEKLFDPALPRKP